LIIQVEGGIQGWVDFEFLEPSIRPTYEAAQYFTAFQTMLYQAERLGHVSQYESSRLIRKMLKLKGDPPADAKRDDNYDPGGSSQPQRDASQERGKEESRRRTRNEQRTKPNK
jgi:hypothetical protein